MLNEVTLIGNLGKEPELKYTNNGSAVCNLNLATTESWVDKASGEKKESVEWHRVNLFGKLAEIAGQYLSKGSKVYIRGKIQTRKWQDKEGNDRYTTEIVVSGFNGVMKMLDSKGENNVGSKPTPTPPVSQDPITPVDASGDVFGDEIPFAPVHHSLMI